MTNAATMLLLFYTCVVFASPMGERMRKVIIVACCSLSLGGCASMFGGTSDDIEVVTSPPGANCSLERGGKVVGRVNPTPGTVTVSKSRDDITVVCVKPDHQSGNGEASSGVEGWVFANMMFGGLIGLAIDHATGAVNDYDNTVHVSLAPAYTQQTPPLQSVVPAPIPYSVPPATSAGPLPAYVAPDQPVVAW